MEGIQVEYIVPVLGGLEDYVADLLQGFRGQLFYHLAEDAFLSRGGQAGLGKGLVDVAIDW